MVVGVAVRVPGPTTAWRWSYVAFRLGDGASSALIPLAVVLEYGLPLWVLAVTTACMNLVGVPASFLWGSAMDRSGRRRRIVVGGFAAAAVAMLVLATFPPFVFYVLAAMAYTVFGVATSPAASILALQGIEREQWARATTSLSRRTGLAYLAGMVTTIAVGLLLDQPPMRALFVAAAVAAALGGLVAWRTIPATFAGGVTFASDVTAAGQRLFDRPVFMPGRMRHKPTWAGIRTGLRSHRLLPVGIVLTFMGSVCFFTSYPGVLVELGLTAGIVLLCQAPSHIVTPFAYPWAGRLGAKKGKSRMIAAGALLRLLGVPGLCLAILILRADAVPLLLVFHALMGLSFSLLQVNGPLLLAEVHPGGKGQGVGLHHAAVGAGTLLGSVLAFVLLRIADYWVSYIAAMVVTLVGVSFLVLSNRRHEAAELPAGAPS